MSFSSKTLEKNRLHGPAPIAPPPFSGKNTRRREDKSAA
ncbi:hypothetical protein L905_15840 [Agrobacterium sp. TS43]|nr:hypothetical protein L902_06500 [Agrobacterium radiobacter DSM 30147]KVK48667.1 hypothetical protein L904_21650 [Agrobacterium sp. LY4]KVK48812.1 hypothetical protein L903_21670 [Agrobacterium sp. JL28]KVK61775.1 hypothetical protein L906_20790 [Agrobacterium sp. TS45]KVK66725.1 hypothetical protein L907_20750 [Agrobacterium sp. C13]KVK67926.1 hypothetical protein L905_15840 [Agrobacterium sp. TS43]